MKLYILQVPILYKLLIFGVLGIFSLVGIVMLAGYFFSFSMGSKPVPLLFVIAWILMVAWNWYVILGIPYEIHVENAACIELMSLKKTTRVSAVDIRSIKPLGGNVYVLKHTRGKIFLFAQFTDFYELLALIKTANPDTEIIGM